MNNPITYYFDEEQLKLECLQKEDWDWVDAAYAPWSAKSCRYWWLVITKMFPGEVHSHQTHMRWTW